MRMPYMKPVFFAAMLSVPGLAVCLGEPLFIRVNQIGYGLQDQKVAVAFSKGSFAEQFTLVSVESQTTVYEGRGRRIEGKTWGQCGQHMELEFSSVKTPGSYILK